MAIVEKGADLYYDFEMVRVPYVTYLRTVPTNTEVFLCGL